MNSLLALSASIATANGWPVAASHPNVSIVGRYELHATGARFDHPGVRITARLTGASWASALLSQSNVAEPNSFALFVDGVPITRQGTFAFNTSRWPSETVSVPLFAGLDPAVPHEVTLVKATEAQWNACVS